MLFEAENHRLLMNSTYKYLVVTVGVENAGENSVLEAMSTFLWALAAKNRIRHKHSHIQISNAAPYILTTVDDYDDLQGDTEGEGPDINELKTFYSKLEIYTRLITSGLLELEDLLKRINDFLQETESILFPLLLIFKAIHTLEKIMDLNLQPISNKESQHTE